MLSDPEPATAAWAVQVASFADQENARNFRAQLREQGFEAFISTTNTNDELRHRVAVGPVLNESDAQALRAQLSELLDLEARLMAFSI